MKKSDEEKESSKRLRNKIIRAWLSENEYNVLLEKAKSCDMNISQYIRKMIADGYIINFHPFDIESVIKEINHIGTNINQIAKRVNEFSAISPSDFEELQMEYEKLWDLYMDKIYGG